MIISIFEAILEANGPFELVSSDMLGILCTKHKYNYDVMLGLYNVWIRNPDVDVEHAYILQMTWHNAGGKRG